MCSLSKNLKMASKLTGAYHQGCELLSLLIKIVADLGSATFIHLRPCWKFLSGNLSFSFFFIGCAPREIKTFSEHVYISKHSMLYKNTDPFIQLNSSSVNISCKLLFNARLHSKIWKCMRSVGMQWVCKQ